jgi:hypothetical protein
MPRGFDFWFRIDLNQPPDQGFTAGSNGNEVDTSTGHPTGNILKKITSLGNILMNLALLLVSQLGKLVMLLGRL